MTDEENKIVECKCDEPEFDDSLICTKCNNPKRVCGHCCLCAQLGDGILICAPQSSIKRLSVVIFESDATQCDFWNDFDLMSSDVIDEADNMSKEELEKESLSVEELQRTVQELENEVNAKEKESKEKEKKKFNEPNVYDLSE